jgi:hypothetical protein
VVKRAKNLRKEADKNTWAKLTLRKKKRTRDITWQEKGAKQLPNDNGVRKNNGNLEVNKKNKRQ